MDRTPPAQTATVRVTPATVTVATPQAYQRAAHRALVAACQATADPTALLPYGGFAYARYCARPWAVADAVARTLALGGYRVATEGMPVWLRHPGCTGDRGSPVYLFAEWVRGHQLDALAADGSSAPTRPCLGCGGAVGLTSLEVVRAR